MASTIVLAVQRKLLSERNLTFDKALEMAQSHETAVRNARTLQTGTSDVSESVHTLQKFQHSNDGPGSDSCYRCGRPGHAPTKCRFRSFKCHQCGRIGHIRAVGLRLKGRRPPAKTDSGET